MNMDATSLKISMDIDKQMSNMLSDGLQYFISCNEIHKYDEFEKVTKEMFDKLKEQYKERGLI